MASDQVSGPSVGIAAAGAKRHVFVISYGRTGSTLLMALLSNHPRVLVRGENRSLFRYLQGAYDSLTASYDPRGSEASNPFYGAHLFQDSFLVPWLRAAAEAFLAGDRAPDTFDVLGFKEAVYNDLDTLRVDLDFIRKLFPGCLLLFNTRDPADVAQSDFNAKWRPERFSRLNQSYRELAGEYGGLLVDYSDIVEFGPQTQAAFARLAINADPDIVARTLRNQQGYVPLGPRTRVSRVPYFVRVLPREDIDFLDVWGVSAGDGLVTVRGGIVGGGEIGGGDWSVDPEDGKVVEYKGRIASGDYSWRLTEPQFQDCGFELTLSASRGGISVSLFGAPLLKVSRISAMPSTRLDVAG